MRPAFKKPLTYAPPCKTIIIRNLPRHSYDLAAVLLKAASPYGTVRDVYIPKNMDASSPYFGTIKGFALVKFADLPVSDHTQMIAAALLMAEAELPASLLPFFAGAKLVGVAHSAAATCLGN